MPWAPTMGALNVIFCLGGRVLYFDFKEINIYRFIYTYTSIQPSIHVCMHTYRLYVQCSTSKSPNFAQHSRMSYMRHRRALTFCIRGTSPREVFDMLMGKRCSDHHGTMPTERADTNPLHHRITG